MTDAEMVYDYYVILLHPTEWKALLLPTGIGWVLPHFTSERPVLWQDVRWINEAVESAYGTPVSTLRCVYRGKDPKLERQVTVYAQEVLAPGWEPPPRSRWFDARDLAAEELARRVQREWLEGFFKWLAKAGGGKRPAWYRRGWYGETCGMLVERLEGLGREVNGRCVQVRSWERSAIIRVSTTEGAFYLKRVPPMFEHEVRLACYLAERFAEFVPPIVDADPAGGWLLAPAYTGPMLHRVGESGQWAEALRAYAALQVALVPEVERLSELGVAMRPLTLLAERAPEIVAWAVANPGRLTAGEVARLQGMVPELQRRCGELADFPIPLSLDHGDLWAGQIVVQDGYRFTDWSDSTISHPFFSFPNFAALTAMLDYLPDGAAAMPMLREAYLEPWGAFARPEVLQEALSLAEQVAPLHFAALYVDRILPEMENRWEMEPMVAFYLSRLL